MNEEKKWKTLKFHRSHHPSHWVPEREIFFFEEEEMAAETERGWCFWPFRSEAPRNWQMERQPTELRFVNLLRLIIDSAALSQCWLYGQEKTHALTTHNSHLITLFNTSVWPQMADLHRNTDWKAARTTSFRIWQPPTCSITLSPSCNVTLTFSRCAH